MNFNYPVNQNPSHSVSNLRLLLHVQGLRLIVGFCPQIMLHDFFCEFGHILRIMRICRITLFNALPKELSASLLKSIINASKIMFIIHSFLLSIYFFHFLFSELLLLLLLLSFSLFLNFFDSLFLGVFNARWIGAWVIWSSPHVDRWNLGACSSVLGQVACSGVVCWLGLLCILLLSLVVVVWQVGACRVEVAHVPLQHRIASAVIHYGVLVLTEAFVDLVSLLAVCGHQHHLVVPVGLGPVHAGVLLLAVHLFHSLDGSSQSIVLLTCIRLSSCGAIAIPVAKSAIGQLVEPMRPLGRIMPVGHALSHADRIIVNGCAQWLVLSSLAIVMGLAHGLELGVDLPQWISTWVRHQGWPVIARNGPLFNLSIIHLLHIHRVWIRISHRDCTFVMLKVQQIYIRLLQIRLAPGYRLCYGPLAVGAALSSTSMLNSAHLADNRWVFVKLGVVPIICIWDFCRIPNNLRRADFGELIYHVTFVRFNDFMRHRIRWVALVVAALDSAVRRIVVMALGAAVHVRRKAIVCRGACEGIISPAHLLMVLFRIINARKKWLISLCFKMEVWL